MQNPKHERDLHHCWWCGRKATIVKEPQISYDYDGWPSFLGYDKYSVKCSFCGKVDTRHSYYTEHKVSRSSDEIRGDADARERAMADWDAGRCHVTTTLALPKNSRLMAREIIWEDAASPASTSQYKFLSSSWFRSRVRSTFAVSTQRGIAEELEHRMLFLRNEEGGFLPLRFNIFDGSATHFHAEVVSVDGKRSDFKVFVFEHTLAVPMFGANKADKKWLEDGGDRPPIFDHIVDIMTGSGD